MPHRAMHCYQCVTTCQTDREREETAKLLLSEPLSTIDLVSAHCLHLMKNKPGANANTDNKIRFI